METNNKYYKPEAHEFHLGFEGQIKYNNKYEDFIVDFSPIDNEMALVCKHVGYCLIMTEEFSYQDIRVKKLDEQDILSLGFKKIDNGWYNTSSKGNGYEILYNKKRLIITYGQHELSLTKFNGFLKNKSELKRILTQIGINL